MTALQRIAVIAALACPTEAWSREVDIANANKTVQALECAALAALREDSSERDRHLERGMKSGREFFNALSNGLVTDGDRQKVSIFVTDNLWAPNSEFALGLIYQQLWDYASARGRRPGTPPRSLEGYASMYLERSCHVE